MPRSHAYVARDDASKATNWSPLRRPQRDAGALAAGLRIDPDQVRIVVDPERSGVGAEVRVRRDVERVEHDVLAGDRHE